MIITVIVCSIIIGMAAYFTFAPAKSKKEYEDRDEGESNYTNSKIDGGDKGESVDITGCEVGDKEKDDIRY
jgi:hypothetical protein